MRIPLALRLRDATRALHTDVERAGVMKRLLKGDIDRAGYVALLRNLHAIYDALETALRHHAAHPGLWSLGWAPMTRAGALERDLCLLHGARWAADLSLVPAAAQYAQHLDVLAREAPLQLAAHVYVRYLGDLSGGQMLARMLSACLHLDDGRGLEFYAFGSAAEVAQRAAGLRTALDGIAPDEPTAQALVDEACNAFVRHRMLFEQLSPAAAPGGKAQAGG